LRLILRASVRHTPVDETDARTASIGAKPHQPSGFELGEIKRGGDGSFIKGAPGEVLRPVLATIEHHRNPLGKR
jgi:hypothetical protein